MSALHWELGPTGAKLRTLGWLIYLFYSGFHPEIGRDFYGTRDQYEDALYWQYRYEPIEDEA